eukprot:TRINITY_DN1813_c0_g1_i1.p1 TRINITY_DN1813_c0_g1~~TRINITY_DN1813_c0_g1_i1.p1  ORF type:complete len:246 (+),score=11.89 TRINITY_DN1813_c0_g1_i1:18-755(+)
MYYLIFGCCVLLNITLLVLSIYISSKTPLTMSLHQLSRWIFIVVLLGLILDNTRFFIGGVSHEIAMGEVMRHLTYVLYFLHLVCLPWIALFALSLLLESKPVRHSTFKMVCIVGVVLFSGCLSGYGGYLLYTKMQSPLENVTRMDIVSYRSEGGSPVGVIATTLLVLLSSICLWIRHKGCFPYLFLCTTICLIGQGLGPLNETYMFLTSNIFEVVFMTGFLVSDWMISLRDRESEEVILTHVEQK